MLHDMMKADRREDADDVKKRFDKLFSEKYPKATKKLDVTWDEVNTFFDFPAAHWKHIRSTNAIESTFAGVKQRTRNTKGAGSAQMAAAMTFKLLLESQRKWRKVSAPENISWVTNKLEIKDGVLVEKNLTEQEAAS